MPNSKIFIIYNNFVLKIVFVYKSTHSSIYSTYRAFYYFIDKCFYVVFQKKDKISNYSLH